MQHITVLKHEAVEGLALTPKSIVVDATLGAGGHAGLILNELTTDGIFIGIDADSTAVSALQSLTTAPATVHLVVENFSRLSEVLENLHLPTVNAILADLGWRTDQFTDGGKGFSFSRDEELLMTYGDPATYAFTANDIVNDWNESDIANVIYGYGEEHYSRRIAAAIVAARKTGRIKTAKELASIIERAVPAGYRNGRTHAATKSFQALRIAVNDEFTALEMFLASAITHLAPGGRLAIITFHSLEDRIVKHTFKEYVRTGLGVLLTKKPIIPTREELQQNPRARSAKLRIIKKI
jgi:16S rRNA (cytosine1402-N4)-methyltransferase